MSETNVKVMKKINNDIFHICYATDDTYAPILAVSVMSLIENNIEVCENMRLWVLAENLSYDNAGRLYDICKGYNVDIHIINIASKLDYIKQKKMSHGNNGSYLTYSRLFIDQLLPEYVTKVLYLDCDTIVVGDIRSFFDIKMKEGKCILGVMDLYASNDNSYFGRINYQGGNYINAGVLLIDLEEWKKEGIFQRVIECINTNGRSFPYMDQDIINMICIDSIQIVSPRYNYVGTFDAFDTYQIYNMFHIQGSNYYLKDYFDKERKEIVIVHFLSLIFFRPWYHNSNHPYAKQWKEYYNKTPYREIPLKKKADKNTFYVLGLFYKILPRQIFSLLYGWLRNIYHSVSDRWM